MQVKALVFNVPAVCDVGAGIKGLRVAKTACPNVPWEGAK
jgi:hypothetical protein